MSRIGKLAVAIPPGVSVEQDGRRLRVRGSKGELELCVTKEIELRLDDNQIQVNRKFDNRTARAQHGLQRTLVANAVTGVNSGFRKQLEVNGVGFKAALSGQTLTLNLGFSHPNVIELPLGLQGSIDGNVITLEGIDKQLLGQVAANIRQLRPPEPYKGKGIKYAGEHIRRKAGKTAGAK